MQNGRTCQGKSGRCVCDTKRTAQDVKYIFLDYIEVKRVTVSLVDTLEGPVVESRDVPYAISFD